MEGKIKSALKHMHRVLWCLFFLSVLCIAEIQPSRIKQIQFALIKRGYKIKVTGRMDAVTEATLRDIAKAHGWQSKSVPDSRVLIHIGLGPQYKNLINPDTAQVAVLEEKR